MTETEIMDTTIETIQKALNAGDVLISRDTQAMDVRGWDSLSHTVVLMSLEDAFNCELPMERTFQLKNVGELVDLISEMIATEKVQSHEI